MSDLTNRDKRRLERLLQMDGGYVLDFSNRTFAEFIEDSIAVNIYDLRFESRGSSKANRLRTLWQLETNWRVGRLLGDLLDYGLERNAIPRDNPLLAEARKSVTCLLQGGRVAEVAALASISDDEDFEVAAKAVKVAIENNELQAGLDRLHTFVTKFMRRVCTETGISTPRDKPLHSLLGEYVKHLRKTGRIESEMTARILNSSISTLDAFNDVRNNRSLAHDNELLNYEEALLIFNHTISSIRFLRNLLPQQTVKDAAQVDAPEADDDIPF